MTLIADPRRRLSVPLDGFIVLYAILYSSFGMASPFLPTFIQARGIAPEHEPSMSDAFDVCGLETVADIVGAILSGKQPPDLTARRLLNNMRLPLDWSEQRRSLGFA